MKRAFALILMLQLAALASAQDAPVAPANPPARPAVAIIAPPASVPARQAPGAEPVPPRLMTPMAELLNKIGETFTDLTPAASAGRFEPGEARAIILGAGALADSDGRIARALWDNRKAVATFVEAGGVLVVFTTPADSGALAFLPGATQASIEELSHSGRATPREDHPLASGRHKLTARDLGDKPGVLYPGGCYGAYLGFSPVAAYDARGRYPIALEGAAGRGRVLLVHLSPDRAFLFGSDAEKISATLLMENVMRWARAASMGEWPAPAIVDHSVRGTVFEDANGNGVFDADERPIPGLDVSDGEALARTDAGGKFYLPTDAYSEFVWVAADLAAYQGTFWRRISPVGMPADIGLAPRKTPIAGTRVAHLVDTGALYDPAAKDDPEIAWALAEIARVRPASDAVVIAGDATSARLPGAGARGDANLLRVFAPGSGAGDLVAERDAFARAFGPTAYVVRLGAQEIAATVPRLIEGRLPGRLAASGPGRVEFTGAGFKTASAAGVTPSFRLRGIATPPTATVIDLGPGAARAEQRILGLTRLLRAVYPGDGAVVAPGPLRPVVIVGDTADGSDVSLTLDLAHVERRDGRLEIVQGAPEGATVVRAGRLTRALEYRPAYALSAGYHILRLSAAWSDGTTMTRHATYSVPGEAPPAPAFGEPWLMTGASESRSGASPVDASPPLRIAGVAHTGFVVPGRSPVVLSDLILSHGLPVMDFLEPRAFTGLPSVVRRLDVPFVCHPQGRYELRGDHAALVTGPVLRYDFGPAAPNPATTHLVVGGDVLCAVDARGTAWGFARARGAEVKDGAYDAKVAAESLRWTTSILPGCRRAATTPLELFTGAECVEVGSGRVRWSWERYALRDRSVALSGRTLVAAGVTRESPAQQKVICMEADTGRVIWEKTLASGLSPLDDAWTPTPSIVRGMVFIGSADGVMRALRLADGEEIWSFATGPSTLPLGPTPARTGRITSQAAVTEECVFFGACDGRLYVLDRRKGTHVWSLDLGLPVVTSPALSGNTLYVADWDGNLYALTSLASKRAKR